MKASTKFQLCLFILIGCALLGMAVYQWYDLHQMELGLKEGALSPVLHKIYDMAGKWGVATFYMPFSIYCFWRAYNIVAHLKENEYEEENNLNNE